MSDLPFELARQKTYAALTASDLETLGRRASDMYLSKQASLNDAVVKLAGQHPGISPDQIKRVVEFTNQNTFQTIFEKQAGDKNVEFDLADPGVVLRDLNDGARPQMLCSIPSEYGKDPVKLGHIDLEADVALCEMFGIDVKPPMMEKIAHAPPDAGRVMSFIQNAPTSLSEVGKRISQRIPFLRKEAMAYIKSGRDLHGGVARDMRDGVSLEAIKEATPQSSYPDSEPHRDLFQTRHKLAAMVEDAEMATDKNFRMMKEAAVDLRHQVGQVVLFGGNFGEVAHALDQVPDSQGLLKVAMEDVVSYLVDKGVDLVKLKTDMVQYQMEKGASARVVNPDNGVVQSFANFVKLASGHHVLAQTQADVKEMFDQVTGVLQEAARDHHVAATQ